MEKKTIVMYEGMKRAPPSFEKGHLRISKRQTNSLVLLPKCGF